MASEPVMSYILYRLEPGPEPGKTIKRPISAHTLRTHDPLDPAHWVTREVAEQIAQLCGPEYGVGWVVQSGYWFVDLDNCRDLARQSGWSETAELVAAMLTGAYVEVSQSGRGLHFIGRGTVPAHRVEVKGVGGLYHEKRFCALTGRSASGSMEVEMTAQIAQVAERWFAPRAGAGATAGTPAVWTEGPVEGWDGPTDDDELLRIAIAEKLSRRAFGDSPMPTFRQLWERDVDALAKAWPDDGMQGREYDYSAADFALARKLLYYTGHDCARTERLMLESALVRDKWDQGNYLRGRTILNALAKQPAIYRRRSSGGGAPGAPGGGGGGGSIDSMVGADQLPAHFADAVYIEDRYVAATADGMLLSPQQFRTSTRYGGRVFVLDSDGTKTTRNAWEAFTENTAYRPTRAHSLCFRPELPPRALIEDSGRILYNSYVDVQTPISDDDPGPFLRHLEKLIPNQHDRLVLICYLAAMVQYPGAKFQWTILLQGVQGNGKTLISAAMALVLGERYVHTPKTSDISNKFNAWIEGARLIVVEEIYIRDRWDTLDTLKPLITNPRIEIQKKGADQITGDNRANFLCFSNYKDAIPKTTDDRRYCVIYTAQQEAADLARDGMDGDYFPRLYRWLHHEGGGAAIHGYLRRFAIVDALNPATLCHRAPVTSSTQEAIDLTRTPAELAILEAAAEGRPGFKAGWASTAAITSLMRDSRHRLPLNAYKRTMEGLGYRFRGRVDDVVQPDNCRVGLYYRGILPDRPIAADARDYQIAHGYTPGSPDLTILAQKKPASEGPAG